MKRVKREKKVKRTHRTAKQKKIRLHARKVAHKPHRQVFVQKELFEQAPAAEEAKTPKKAKFWIYFLVIIIIVLILIFIRFIPQTKTSTKVEKSSSVVSMATAVVTQQAIQEKVILEKSETSVTKEKKITIIYFSLNKWEVQYLSAKEKNKLNTLIEELLKDKPIQGLFVYGYADRTGLRSYNLVVSEKRARNIAEFLSEKIGVEPDKIVVQGKGEVLEGPDGVENPLFRKVEIIKK